MHQVAAAIYRLSLALWVGGMSVFTFVVTPVIFRTQTRDSAGKIVGALFPVYFRFCLVVTAAALVARAASGKAFAGARQLAGTLLVVFCLAIVSYHAFGLGPRMATVRETVVSLEAAPKEDPARREFSRLHGVSMTLNLVVILAGAILILWHDAFRR
jgi:uncharacterized membrane protein